MISRAGGMRAAPGKASALSWWLALEASLFGLCAGTEDKAEGTDAFLHKRAANFRGR